MSKPKTRAKRKKTDRSELTLEHLPPNSLVDEYATKKQLADHLIGQIDKHIDRRILAFGRDWIQQYKRITVLYFGFFIVGLILRTKFLSFKQEIDIGTLFGLFGFLFSAIKTITTDEENLQKLVGWSIRMWKVVLIVHILFTLSGLLFYIALLKHNVNTIMLINGALFYFICFFVVIAISLKPSLMMSWFLVGLGSIAMLSGASLLTVGWLFALIEPNFWINLIAAVCFSIYWYFVFKKRYHNCNNNLLPAQGYAARITSPERMIYELRRICDNTAQDEAIQIISNLIHNNRQAVVSQLAEVATRYDQDRRLLLGARTSLFLAPVFTIVGAMVKGAIDSVGEGIWQKLLLNDILGHLCRLFGSKFC